MSIPLPNDLRNQLEKVIVKARDVAEKGSRNSLIGTLAVSEPKPGEKFSDEQKDLRRRLRARARQLGDRRDPRTDAHEIDHLVAECAYEHWHRMLFARFLVENDLLIHPEEGIAVSLEECEDLAEEEDARDAWELAERYAARMLPQIFRPDAPALKMALAPECRMELEELLDSLKKDVFTASDSLGWVYQFWQSKRKDEVNASGNKIGADDLPAVTQLFTEHYMVLFLYHNTIGAWHAGKVLAENPDLAETADSEEELRQAVALDTTAGREDWEYLRFVREMREGDEEDSPTGPWRPAAGAFDGWPKTACELKVLDPSCGSGHFLVVGFMMLVRLRMHEEGLGVEEAIHNVLTDNLYGLELDPRCTQIAAFNLAMTAWKLAGGPIELPTLSIACSGLAVGSTKTEWTKLAGKDALLKMGMELLYDLFEQAPELGSLIDPTDLQVEILGDKISFSELQPLLEEALERESDDFEKTERAVAAQGMARAAEMLSSKYTLVITNVPYLLAGKMDQLLKLHIEEKWPAAKNDLAFSMMLRWLMGIHKRATVSLVLPNTFLFMSGYTNLRKEVLNNHSIDFLARLGPGAFSTISGEIVRVALLIITRGQPAKDHTFADVGVDDRTDAPEKNRQLRIKKIDRTNQLDQLKNPESRLVVGGRSSDELLGEYADSYIGLQTSDNPRFYVCLWEIGLANKTWRYLQTPAEASLTYSGRNALLRWDNGAGDLQLVGQIKGTAAWEKQGVAVRLMSNLPPSLYNGEIFEQSSAAIIPTKPEYLGAIWCYCKSDEFCTSVRRIDQAIKITNKTFEKIDFDFEKWNSVFDKEYPNGLPEPESDDPTQWLFHGHPARAEPATVLQVAIARLLGYRWPPELDPDMLLSDEARKWVARCEALNDLADEDGIVCIPAVRGEQPAENRLVELLTRALENTWSSDNLLEAADFSGKTIEKWLRDAFFKQHLKLFHKRPFIWQIWDGRPDGFSALVNYHKLDRKLLENLTYNYLGDWIAAQKADLESDVAGAEARLIAAEELQDKLKKIIEGEAPCDIFVRWKPLEEQPIGWEPDLNDGVRINIRPFVEADVLRAKTGIKWGKDRGKEPESLRPKSKFPWFWGCKGNDDEEERTDYTSERARGREFDGNRWNDLHYTREVKEAERAAAKEREEQDSS